MRGCPRRAPLLLSGMRLVGVTAIGFDLGDTLIEYEGLPLSWEAHYGDAVRALAVHLGHVVTSDDVERAAAVLRRYNTRLQPRTHEVAFREILSGLCEALGLGVPPEPEAAARSFFQVFRCRLRAFPDAQPALAALRHTGLRVGVFTDVPYGMPRELVLEDIAAAGLHDSFDVMLTSGDVGFRKPSSRALAALARALGVSAPAFAYVGNERKDIEAGRAFGCRTILLDRAAQNVSAGENFSIRTLAELLDP